MNTHSRDSSVANPSTLVLVVDDDAFSHKLFSAMLGKLGVTDIHNAPSGRTALQTMAGLPRPPDILICDVFMPDMDGFEFLAELAKAGFQGGVILVSGQDITMLDIAQQLAVANGLKMLGAYAKPLPLDVLAECMARYQQLVPRV